MPALLFFCYLASFFLLFVFPVYCSFSYYVYLFVYIFYFFCQCGFKLSHYEQINAVCFLHFYNSLPVNELGLILLSLKLKHCNHSRRLMSIIASVWSLVICQMFYFTLKFTINFFFNLLFCFLFIQLKESCLLFISDQK